MSWRRLNGSRILLPIKEAVERTIQKELKDGFKLKICIGTDSQVRGKKIGFATVIVFLREGKGGFMFINSEIITQKMAIRERMIHEVSKSVALAYELSVIWDKYSNIALEIHADINAIIIANKHMCINTNMNKNTNANIQSNINMHMNIV